MLILILILMIVIMGIHAMLLHGALADIEEIKEVLEEADPSDR